MRKQKQFVSLNTFIKEEVEKNEGVSGSTTREVTEIELVHVCAGRAHWVGANNTLYYSMFFFRYTFFFNFLKLL